MSKPRSKASRPASKVPSQTTEDVDPRWIIKALALTLVAAVFCAYLTLCLLFYQGQWQLILHPSQAVTATPATLGLKFEPVTFGVDESGKPTLNGWYIPASLQSGPTILYLHDGDSTIGAAIPHIGQLHNLNFNVLAIDYRGYGASAPTHPTQARMTEDVERTFTYLTVTRKLPPGQIIPYGVGVGTSLAASLAATHSEIPAIVLENPYVDLLSEVAKDPRTHHLPIGMLFHDRFPLEESLKALKTPKLLLTNDAEAPKVYKDAADPKYVAEFPAANQTAYADALQRFAGEYLHQLVPGLVSTGAPITK